MEMLEEMTEIMTDPDEPEKIESPKKGIITDTKNLVKMRKSFLSMVQRKKKETQEDQWIKNLQEKDSLVYPMNLTKNLSFKKWRKKSVVKEYRLSRERKSLQRSKIYNLGMLTWIL